MKAKIALAAMLIFTTVMAGCRTAPQKIEPAYDRPLRPGQLALRKVDHSQIPDFTLAGLDLTNLRAAIDSSLRYLNKRSSKAYFPSGEITHSRVVDSLTEFASLLDSGLFGDELDAAIREKFDVYTSVGYDDAGSVLFTGYYTPIFEGSVQTSDRFRYPLYKQPKDLVKGADGIILGRRESDGRITQYPQRAVIENANMLRGTELVWLSDPFEAYIAHVQGSAKIKMPDGQIETYGYTAANGHEYKSIGREMIRDGVISKAGLSLGAMIDYFKANADQVTRYTWRNPRYVFFKKEAGSPRGCLNEPVIPMRTIATDKSIFPRGALAFLSVTLPQPIGNRVVNQSFSGFVLDQDAGGAIRAPGRCDIYMGEGDLAGKLAGQTYQQGRLYYLFLKSGSVALQY